MAIQIRSFNQILGDMIRKILAETPLNDINAGSILLSLLEAAAANDFENNAAILNVLELLNIDAVKNNDLDARAGDFGLTRYAAIKASGQVSILNTNITKRSTGLYVIKPAPIAGQTVLFVNNTTGWASSGNLYIGRGTQSFEGPIAYSSITVFPTYSQINLSSALNKDHLISDIVIDSQGEPDRIISAGTIVGVPANSQNPEIQYITLRDAVIPAGEDRIDGVTVIALIPGSQGNAGINTITDFDTPPFSGASVTNSNAFSNGSDIETDVQLRNRIKSYSITLARGTAASIIAAVIGVSDPDDNKQVASAVLTEPVSISDPSILYIDDGSGFQPSYAGQSVDILLSNATGKEEFLQLSNYPLPRPQVVNVESGPFNITDGSFLRVIVDGAEETIFFSASQFLNISASTLAEIIVAINSNSTLFKARFANNSTSTLLYPVAHDAEIIEIASLRPDDNPLLYVNTLFKFPTNAFSYISLYKNATRLHEKAKSATLESTSFASWNITSTGDIIISVDGTPAQDRSFALSDFPGASSFATLSLAQWVTAINAKFAGLTAEATPSQTFKITSNKIGAASELNVTGGSYLNKWFPNLATSSVGQDSQFQLNRQTGNLRVLDIESGDTISAGVEDAKGFSISASTSSGNYNVSSDASGRAADMVVVADSTFCDQRTVPLLVGATITITNPSGSVMRITSSTLNAFASLLPGDFIYIVGRSAGWVNSANAGLFKIHAKGNHITANVDSFVDVYNTGAVPESNVSILDSLDIKAFTTNGFPQIWRGSYVSNPPAAPLTDIVNSLNIDLINVKASIYKSNSIKLTSTTEENGSIAIPISISNASVLFTETVSAQLGNPPHIAHRVSDKSLFAFFKTGPAVSTNVWLNRHIYSDIKGSLSADSVPDSPPFSGTYSEIVSSAAISASTVDYDNYISFTRGNNRGQFRNVKAFTGSNQIGTQESTARTELDHITGDEFQMLKPVQLSADDGIVIVMDKNPTIETVDINMARTGRVNSGSGAGSFIPTTTEFSADDADNEPGVDFSNTTVWGTTINSTNFSDYAVYMRAHNWYAGGGLSSGQGQMIVRANEYGPNGQKLRFALGYPSTPNQAGTTSFLNTPSFSTLTYFFGSGAARPIAISAGTTISVSGPYPNAATNFPNGITSSGNYYDYTFSLGNFATVQVGDVLSVSAGSGISVANSGQFRVNAKSGNTVRVFNPTGSDTAPGSPEITTVTATADVVGTPTSYQATTVADVGGNLNLKYFIIYDTMGSVAVWYDVNNTGEPPPPHGANRAIKVATVVTGDSASVVATKTGQAIILDNAFGVGVIGNQVTITNKINGPLASGSAGTSGFVVTTTTGTTDNSVNGKYFIIYDTAGSVAVWYDVDNRGTPEPFHGAQRSIKVSGVISGMSATNVAAATVAAVNPDLFFNASNLAAVVTITASSNGNLPASTAGTSGFGISNTAGSFSTAELITNPNDVTIFSLSGNDVASIVAAVNAGQIIELVAFGSSSLTILKATREDDYTYSGNSTALAYGHNPTNSTLRDHVSLYDGVAWVKAFSNSNPNFTLKNTLLLNGVAPSIYSMNTVPNAGTADLGEFFKLVPTSVKNVYHHMTQKALSQLPIIANISIADDRKNVQITSKNLGSAGAIEVIGGNANKAQAYLQTESEVASDTSGSYLLAKIPAFPDTFNDGDYVKIQNDTGVKRLSRLISTDSINVTVPAANTVEYNYNPKTINVTSSTQFTITDVSASYGRPAGFVWRWTHDGSATLAQVKAGDLITTFGSTIPWAQGNQAGISGDEKISGLPIINVNDTSNYVDVINPLGKAMSSTAVGSGNTVQICPTPAIKWNLTHAARTSILSLIGNGTTATVITSGAHRLNTGDMVSIIDSNNLTDGTYGPVTVTAPTIFTFSNGLTFSEASVGASSLKSGLVPTRYRIEKLGFNSMIRLSRFDGESPRFSDCGVALDDYILLGGSTFASNNNGRFRVLSVDNDSIVLINNQATDELNTTKSFNNKSFLATWAANTSVVTGIAGTFKNVNVGDWVKKPEDPDSYYLQVLSMSPSTPALATQINLGGTYLGVTDLAPGLAYDELNNFDHGVTLQNVEDIIVFEGDAVAAGDTISIQNIINTNWFSVNNIGTFSVAEFGTNGTTFKPFVRINNSNGIAESVRQMSVSVGGVYITESLTNKFYSIRLVNHAVMDDLSTNRRSIYLTPDNRSYKFSDANATSITHMGKLGYSTDVTTGIDGYLYYTGLLRRVQRIVDGFEPDATNFPGRRAVGGLIETLPPLVRRISISINVTTSDGVNLGDITNNIKSVIINYVQDLGVGQDVILSEIIAQVMNIKGVAAVTFTNPVPSTERITIANNERANVVPQDIGIA